MRFIVIYTFNSIIFQCGGGGHVGTGPEDGTVFNLNIKVWFTARHKQHSKHFPASPLPLLYMFLFLNVQFLRWQKTFSSSGWIKSGDPFRQQPNVICLFFFHIHKKKQKNPSLDSQWPPSPGLLCSARREEEEEEEVEMVDGGRAPLQVSIHPPPPLFFSFLFFLFDMAESLGIKPLINIWRQLPGHWENEGLGWRRGGGGRRENTKS